MANKAAGALVTAPSETECNKLIDVELNASQVTISIFGQDDGSATKCSDFTELVAKSGLRMRLLGAPYASGSRKADLEIDLTPEQ